MAAPSAGSTPPARPARSRIRQLPVATVALAGVLLLMPVAAMAIVPVYSRQKPQLWGFPFFYWYSILWTLLTPVFTYSAYLVIEHARRPR